MSSRKSALKTSKYRCSECGWVTAKWVGRCGQCQQWGTVTESGSSKHTAKTSPAARVDNPAQPIATVDSTPAQYLPTGNSEFDRVLGSGLVPGAVILLAGEPGVGKSTLLLDIAARFAQTKAKSTNRQVLYLSGEESAAQVKLRAERIGALAENLYLSAETDLATALAQLQEIKPDLLVLDSVQTFASSEVEGSAGGPNQVREVAAALIAQAKARNMACILVGHVTKEGSIAGPRLLEHLVDVVCQFEGDKHSAVRMLRAVKNRYGPTDEVGCFEMQEAGIKAVTDPSGLFISPTAHPVAGTCLTVTMEGRRPLLAEIQALLDQASGPQPRRATAGLESNRIAMLLAVLQKRAGFPVGKLDCYISTVGGAKISEPAADLAAVIALASAAQDKPLTRKLAVFGEVGLAGEVRTVPGIKQRIAEVARLGFTHALVPASPQGPGKTPANITVREVTSINDALAILFPQG